MKLGQLIYIEFDDAIMDDSEYIYLNQAGGIVNRVEGRHTASAITALPAYFVDQTPNWILVCWLHSPKDEEGKWSTTFRIPIKWIRSVRRLSVGSKITLP